jgi:hypothetical protein
MTTTNGDTTNITEAITAIGPTVSITLSTTPGPTLNALDRNRLRALIDDTGHCLKPWPSPTIAATLSRLRRLAAQSEYQPATLGLRLAVGPDRADATSLEVVSYDGIALGSETSFHPRKPERRARVRSPTEAFGCWPRTPGPCTRSRTAGTDQAFRQTHTELTRLSVAIVTMVLKNPSRVTRFPGVTSQTVVCRPICDGWTAIAWPPGMPADESIPHAMAGHLDADTWVPSVATSLLDDVGQTGVKPRHAILAPFNDAPGRRRSGPDRQEARRPQQRPDRR